MPSLAPVRKMTLSWRRRVDMDGKITAPAAPALEMMRRKKMNMKTPPMPTQKGRPRVRGRPFSIDRARRAECLPALGHLQAQLPTGAVLGHAGLAFDGEFPM